MIDTLLLFYYDWIISDVIRNMRDPQFSINIIFFVRNTFKIEF